MRKMPRRSFLQSGLGAISLPAFLRQREVIASQQSSNSMAKNCIVLYCWGGMSHFESFDPKPDAPLEIRGEFQPIATSVPGMNFSEHLPKLATGADRLAVVRSVNHNSSSHGKGMYWNLTGHAPPRAEVAANLAPSVNDWPSLGAMISQFASPAPGIPASLRLPYPLVDNGTLQAGEYAGWLGVSQNPIVIRTPGGREFGGVSRNLGSAVLNFQEDINLDQLRQRTALLESLERPFGTATDFLGFQHYRQLAQDMLTTETVKQAYRLEEELPAVHQQYGDHICGQSLLLSRRLVEAGVPLITVCCAAGDLNGSVGDHWDTHGNNFGRLKNAMLPVFDQSVSALLTDLQERGLLDETLVVMLTDFGRTPQINAAAGRDHYPNVYSVFFAGAGVRGGQVYGSSDKNGALPLDNPCTPADLHATIFHALGISPRAEIHDRLGRPFPVCDGYPLPIFS